MGHENLTEFLASLPPAINTRGGNKDTLAQTVRSDIALAVKRGLIPAGTKVSVRRRDYNDFTVEIVAWVGPVFVDAYYAHLLDPEGTPWTADDHGHYWDQSETLVEVRGCRHGRKEQTHALNHALYVIEQIADRHNYDNSDPMTDYFDVGYYLTVNANTVTSAIRNAAELERNPAFVEKLARAKVAAKTLGAKCVRAVCGKNGIDRCSEWSLDRLLRIAERANGRPVAYDKSLRGWFPVSPVVPPHDIADCDGGAS